MTCSPSPPGKKNKRLAVIAELYARLADSRFAAGTCWRRWAASRWGYDCLLLLPGCGRISCKSLTLLAQDSVGGKTSVDIPEGKNLVGAFWQPARVIADPRRCWRHCLGDVLPNGLAEVVKSACIRDEGLFIDLENSREARTRRAGRDHRAQHRQIKRDWWNGTKMNRGGKAAQFLATRWATPGRSSTGSHRPDPRPGGGAGDDAGHRSRNGVIDRKGTAARLALPCCGSPAGDRPAELDDILPGGGAGQKGKGAAIDLVTAACRRGRLYRIPSPLLGPFLQERPPLKGDAAMSIAVVTLPPYGNDAAAPSSPPPTGAHLRRSGGRHRGEFSPSDDMGATLRAVSALGVRVRMEGTTARLKAADRPPAVSGLQGESGSTLRFLLPVFAALGDIRHPRHGLPPTPSRRLCRLPQHGAELHTSGGHPLTISGRLAGGGNRLPGDVSSQFISGLLFRPSLSLSVPGAISRSPLTWIRGEESDPSGP